MNTNRLKLLVTLAHIRANTRIESNVEDTVIRPVAVMAQEVTLQNIIGTNLYEYLLADRDVTTATYTGITAQTMITFIEDYVEPGLFSFVTFEFINSNAVNLSNVGIQEAEGAASTERLKIAIKHAEANSNFFANRIRNYLVDNYDFFKEWICDHQNLNPNKNINSSSIYIPKNDAVWRRNNPKKYRL